METYGSFPCCLRGFGWATRAGWTSQRLGIAVGTSSLCQSHRGFAASEQGAKQWEGAAKPGAAATAEPGLGAAGCK